jgi:uncharacterized membrane-anchored protein YitT (DUF2179 family)
LGVFGVLVGVVDVLGSVVLGRLHFLGRRLSWTSLAASVLASLASCVVRLGLWRLVSWCWAFLASFASFVCCFARLSSWAASVLFVFHVLGGVFDAVGLGRLWRLGGRRSCAS